MVRVNQAEASKRKKKKKLIKPRQAEPSSRADYIHHISRQYNSVNN